VVWPDKVWIVGKPEEILIPHTTQQLAPRPGTSYKKLPHAHKHLPAQPVDATPYNQLI
jgi:hypothetical protein